MKLKLRVWIPLILQSFAWPPTRLMFNFFCHFEVRGSKNLKSLKGDGVIFATNHISEWDPILVTAALPLLGRFTPLFYVSMVKSHYTNSGMMKHIYGGNFFKAWGAHPVYKGEKDYEKALVHHIDLLNSGQSLCIFPEGKRSETGELGKPRGGVAFLAHRTNKPVVPVSIQGIHKMSAKEFFSRKRKIIITFGEVLKLEDIFSDVENISLEGYKRGSEMILEDIKKLII